MRENERPPSRDAITRSVARPSWIHAANTSWGLRGFTATEVSCENPGSNPVPLFVQGPPVNGLGSEISAVRTVTDRAEAGPVPTAAKINTNASTNTTKDATASVTGLRLRAPLHMEEILPITRSRPEEGEHPGFASLSLS